MARPKTTDFLTLDVRPLLRMGVGAVQFPGAAPWLPFARRGDVLRVGYEPAVYRIALVSTKQPFGGARWWARCDGCGGRCAVLLLSGPGGRCRRCVGACYPVTREGFMDRALRRARRARERLGMGPNLMVAPMKPPRMHWHTFLRLAERADEAAGAAIGAAVARSERGLDRVTKRLTRTREERRR